MPKKEQKRLLVSNNVITKDDLTPSQQIADKYFKDWYFSKKSKKEQILRIGGCAGSGKTTFITYLIDKYKFNLMNCMVLSYTGQSVNNLRQRAILAKTIHSAIMVPMDEILRDKAGNPIMKRGVPITTVKFNPVPHLSSKLKLIIIDEASFLPESLENTLKSYGVPILEMGDPLQLPPVAGKQCFNMNNLDYFITGIMRQKEDNEIVDLSMRIRYGERIDINRYHKDVMFIKSQPDIYRTLNRLFVFYKDADMIITSTNKQRQAVNDFYRKKILHTDSDYPIRGERLICRKNNWNLSLGEFPLTNGTQGICTSVTGRSMIDKKTKSFYMDFKPVFIDNDYYDNILCDSEYLNEPFGSDKRINFKHPGEKFEYAYAITTQLSQGSQYDKVLFMDSFGWDDEYNMRRRYTASTRAVNTLFYVMAYSTNYNASFIR